jgi:hypothetical protein
MGDVFDQAAQTSQPRDVFDAAASGQSDSDWMKALKGEDTNVMLTSHAAATKQGVLNVIQGVSQGVQGIYQGIKGAASMMETPGVNPATGELTAGSAGRAAQSTGRTAQTQASQVAQVPGAVQDINQSADPLGMYAQVAQKTAGQAGGQALTALGTEGLAKAVPKVLHQGATTVRAVKELKDVPAALSTDTSSTLATVAHNEGLPPLTSTTAREAADELSQSFVKRAKDQYGVVDKAVGGDLKPVQERITNLKKAIRAQANVNPDLADKYIEDLAQQQKTLASLVEKAKASGVTNAEDLMAAGDKDYAKGMAMKDVSKGVKTTSGIAKSGGHPNPVLFANQVDRLYNRGTLTRALGEDGAQAMLDTAKKGLSKAKTASAVKKVATAAVIGGAGAAGVVGVKSALSGE